MVVSSTTAAAARPVTRARTGTRREDRDGTRREDRDDPETGDGVG